MDDDALSGDALCNNNAMTARTSPTRHFAAGFSGIRHPSSLCCALSNPGNMAKSGSIPCLSMSFNPGVTYLPTVSTSPLPSLSSYTL